MMKNNYTHKNIGGLCWLVCYCVFLLLCFVVLLRVAANVGCVV